MQFFNIKKNPIFSKYPLFPKRYHRKFCDSISRTNNFLTFFSFLIGYTFFLQLRKINLTLLLFSVFFIPPFTIISTPMECWFSELSERCITKFWKILLSLLKKYLNIIRQLRSYHDPTDNGGTKNGIAHRKGLFKDC